MPVESLTLPEHVKKARPIDSRRLWTCGMALFLGAPLWAASPTDGTPGSAGFATLSSLQQSSRARIAKYADVFSGVDPKFSGVRAYGKALRELDASKPWDLETLTVKNPDYWRAIMEMVPEDPSIAFSNAYLCAMQGRLNRAEAWLFLGGIGMDPLWNGDRDELKKGIAAERAEVASAMKRGTVLHDAGKYQEAIKAYDAVLTGAPEDPWALYEKSFSMLSSDQQGSAAAREELYRRIRRADPFYWQAYQGTDHDVINRQLPLLLSQVQPFLSAKASDAKGLARFADGAEKIGIHDFAALAFWKLFLINGDADHEMAHFFFNLKRLGLDPFVQSVAGPEILKTVAELESRAPKPDSGAVSGSILSYGLYRMPKGVELPSSPTGGKTQEVRASSQSETPVLAQAVDRVPATRGVLFGYQFLISGLGAGANGGWKTSIRHPLRRCPGVPAGSRDVTPLNVEAKDGVFSGWLLYSFDEGCELLKGRWTMQVMRERRTVRLETENGGAKVTAAQTTSKDEVMVSKDFEVIAPPVDVSDEAAAQDASDEAMAQKRRRDKALARACFNEIGILCHSTRGDSQASKNCLKKHEDELLSGCKKALFPSKEGSAQ